MGLYRFFYLERLVGMGKIDKVINNNIIITHDDKEKEVILMGKALGFKKHTGDSYDPAAVEKRYYLSSAQSSNSNHLLQLLSDIPIEEFEAASAIIDAATTTLGKPLNDGTVISLGDHIHTAIERGKTGVFVKNILLWDIQRFYPDEYKVGRAALDIIKEKTGFELPEDEAGFIALHIVNAQMDNSVGDMYGLTKIMQIVRYSFRITFNERSAYYYRFITHLKFFAQRLICIRPMRIPTTAACLTWSNSSILRCTNACSKFRISSKIITSIRFRARNSFI